MLSIKTLDVGHGLCVIANDGHASFVYDCGTHGGLQRPARAGRRLRSVTRWFPPVGTLVLSHLHTDHYAGFLRPIPNVDADARFALSRMPILNEDPRLSGELVMRMIAFAPLDPYFGPLDIDLLRRVRSYVPRLRPTPLSRGEEFVAVGQRWKVLWPPHHLALGVRRLSAIKRTIELYDEAAALNPALRQRLAAIRNSEDYARLLDHETGDSITDMDRVQLPDERGEDGGELNERERRRAPAEDDPVARAMDAAGRALRRAANALSLVLHTPRAGVLLTGDAPTTVMEAAMGGLEIQPLRMVLTPHHGGRNHVPQSLLHTGSSIWISSAGRAMSAHVADHYDSIPGLHLRTDRHGDITVDVDARGRLRGLTIHPSRA